MLCCSHVISCLEGAGMQSAAMLLSQVGFMHEEREAPPCALLQCCCSPAEAPLWGQGTVCALLTACSHHSCPGGGRLLVPVKG